MQKIIFFLIIPILLQAQNSQYTEKEKLQGYKQTDDQLIFLFDESMYNVNPVRVIVEGSMRNWDHSLDDSDWWLKKQNGNTVWTLTIQNPEYRTIPPGTAFKYRINDGDWMNPPENAPNIKDGNLILAPEIKPLRLKAEIAGPRDIQLIFTSAIPKFQYEPAKYKILTHSGETIQAERVFYIEPGKLQIVPSKDIEISRLHYLKTPYKNDVIPVNYNGWFKHLYSDKALGANFIVEENATWIRLFAPRADSVKVYLYLEPDDSAENVIPLERDDQGIWETRLQGNWEGWYYDFTAYGPDEPGNHFYQQNPVHFTDPWGRVSVDTFGPCRIWPKMEPARPLKHGIPKMEDVISYEVHVQDFTRYLPIEEQYRGTFSGFAKTGLKNSHGVKIGFDYLTNLGINVVHLMPVQEYLHFPDDEWQKAFLNDPYMIEQGINTENYQWGYRTSHAFALESRYRVKGTEWGAQNEQFRDLVQQFHDHNIAVIVDLVFNHTAERMDNRQYYFNFSAIDVPYFYRTNDELDYIGEYGTETKSEQRPMMQRWIIEQCTDLINQYGIDGFRIDLAGQTDEQTLRALREAVGPEIIIYGEPWIASADPDYENNPDWDWYKADAPITFFQDDSRNAFKGPTSNPKNKTTDRGYAGGNGKREDVKKALSAGFPEDKTPLSGINYLDIHDNWALSDRFAKTNWDGRYGVDENQYKIAATLLFTSPGPIVLHGGSEMMRSKGVAPLQEQTKYTESGPIYLHGKRDSYNLARANAFLWDNAGVNINEDEGIYCNYKNMYEFWKGLIAFRKSKYGRVFRIAEKPADGYYQWLEPENTKLLGYIVNQSVLILLNTDKTDGTFRIDLPAGEWQLIADNGSINYNDGLKSTAFAGLKGNKIHQIKLPGESLRIWLKK
jgi:pullulanase